MTGMCPNCGEEVEVRDGLTAAHNYPPTFQVCPGSWQNARCAESDGRRLWNGERNRRFAGRSTGPWTRAAVGEDAYAELTDTIDPGDDEQ